MTKRHDALFDDVLSGLDAPAPAQERDGARFLKRTTTIADRLSGDLEEKTLRWVDPAACRMWDRHNRDYELLNEENCRDLIDGIRAQGRQEFPAIVRRVSGADGHEFEVICGARRHFAVSWLRANNYTQFRYLVEVRDLSDEEAFRLADIENRDREDISDYERAIDYADAIERYYGGKQKAMADRLEVSQPWLSRYLQLARLPQPIVQAFPTIRHLRERHARDLKPLLSGELSGAVMQEAAALAREQARGFVDPLDVMKRLRAAGTPDAPARKEVEAETFTALGATKGITVRRKGRRVMVEFDDSITRRALEGALDTFLKTSFKR